MYPPVTTKLDATITEPLRCASILNPLQQYAHHHCPRPSPSQASLSSPSLEVLILGPGHKGTFVPEFMEVSAILWEFPVHFTVVDHNPTVLESLDSELYYFPNHFQPLYGISTTDHTSLLNLIHSISIEVPLEKEDESTANVIKKRRFDYSQARHSRTLLNVNFTALSLPCGSYDVIIALNSLYYLLNDKAFDTHQAAFLRTLLGWLKPGGLLFVDKITRGLVTEHCGERRGVNQQGPSWEDEQVGPLIWKLTKKA